MRQKKNSNPSSQNIMTPKEMKRLAVDSIIKIKAEKKRIAEVHRNDEIELWAHVEELLWEIDRLCSKIDKARAPWDE